METPLLMMGSWSYVLLVLDLAARLRQMLSFQRMSKDQMTQLGCAPFPFPGGLVLTHSHKVKTMKWCYPAHTSHCGRPNQDKSQTIEVESIINPSLYNPS